ncbi:hypothetical protein KAR91_50800 [Candidatus Pacearchaeota archaeon]|nr:hypothetical protein [Candidatus Pacearchaeota archaeon]
MGYDNYNFSKGRRNRIIGPSQIVASAGIFTPTVDQKYTLGLELDLNDGTGRMFRYCQNSSAATLAKALMNASAALDADAITSTIQANYGVSAGEKKFDVLLTTGNAWSDSALIDGWLLIGDGGTALGDMYLIKDNKWTTSDTVMNVTISDEGGLRVAIAATDDVVLFQSKYRNTIVNPTTQSGGVVGVSLADVTASYYYWAQFRGYCPMLVDASDTIVVGEPCGKAGTAGTAGAVGLVENDGTDAVWGTCVYPSTTAECAIVDLMLP